MSSNSMYSRCDHHIWGPTIQIAHPCVVSKWPPFCEADLHVDIDLRIHFFFSSVHGRHFENHHPLQTIMQTSILRIYSYILSVQGHHFENHYPCRPSCRHQFENLFLHPNGRHFENHHLLSRPSCRHRFENLFLLLICTIWPTLCKSSFPSDHNVDMDMRIHSYFSSVLNWPPFCKSPSPANHLADINLRIYSYLSSVLNWPPFLRITFPCRSSCRLRFENLFLRLICSWPPFCKQSSPLQQEFNIDLRIKSYYSSVHCKICVPNVGESSPLHPGLDV